MARSKLSTFSISPQHKTKLVRQADRLGVSQTAYLERLIDMMEPGHEAYFSRTAAFNSFMTNALLVPLLIKLLDADTVRAMVMNARNTAPSILGELPERPEGLDIMPSDDPRIWALFEAFGR